MLKHKMLHATYVEVYNNETICKLKASTALIETVFTRNKSLNGNLKINRYSFIISLLRII